MRGRWIQAVVGVREGLGPPEKTQGTTAWRALLSFLVCTWGGPVEVGLVVLGPPGAQCALVLSSRPWGRDGTEVPVSKHFSKTPSSTHLGPACFPPTLCAACWAKGSPSPLTRSQPHRAAGCHPVGGDLSPQALKPSAKSSGGDVGQQPCTEGPV